MAISLPQSQTGTYIQNGVRSDLLHTLSPSGYGVPLMNYTGTLFSPFYSKPGEIFASGDAVKISKGNIPLTASKETNPSYSYIGVSPTNPTPYLQFDSQRCLNFSFAAESTITSTTAVIMTITGYDNRGIKVQEAFQFPINGKKLTNIITSYKAYSALESINFSNDITFSKSFQIGLSNIYFGHYYYAPIQSSQGSVVSTLLSSGTEVVSELLSLASMGFGFNFRIGTTSPNATPVVLTENTPPNVPSKFSNTQKDARGIFQLRVELDPTSTKLTIIQVNSNVMGSDATLNEIISQALPNGSTLPQRAAQRAIAASPKDTTNARTTPTQLTQFDVFGAQYPGDAKLFNQTFPNNKMVVA